MRCAGQNVTESVLGSLKNGQRVIVEDDVAKLPDRSAFAGSIATADRLLRVMHRQADVPLQDCIYMMTQSPAKVLGIDDRKGALRRSMDCDLVLLDQNLSPRMVWVNGERRYLRETEREEQA